MRVFRQSMHGMDRRPCHALFPSNRIKVHSRHEFNMERVVCMNGNHMDNVTTRRGLVIGRRGSQVPGHECTSTVATLACSRGWMTWKTRCQRRMKAVIGEAVNHEYDTEDSEPSEGEEEDLRESGYTPFEFIEFTNIPLKHQVSVWVDRGISDCYKIWDFRLNWMQWFDMIDEIGFHEEEPSYMSMYMWYRWATTPFLELYVTLERTKEEVNKYILEEPVEGLPLVAAVLFQEGEEGGTVVTLRISYLLPKVLYEFAGQLAVYGDVDKKLQASMEKMKSVVEAVDMNALEAMQKENEEKIKANFMAQREKKQAAKKKQEETESMAVIDMDAATAAKVDQLSEELENEESDGKKMTKKKASKGSLVKNSPTKKTTNTEG